MLVLTAAQCDITDLDTVRQVVEPSDVVSTCAAYTQVVREEHPSGPIPSTP